MFQLRRGTQITHLEERIFRHGASKASLWEQILQRATYHVRNKLFVRSGSDGAGRDAAAIAQHRKRVGDFSNLFEEMADVNDSDGLLAELANY